MSPKSKPLLTLYALRNRDGKFFRAKGYGGTGATWVDSLDKAKIYSKISQARAQVTYFAKTYPNFGIPVLVELNVTSMSAVKETQRVKNAVKRIKTEEEQRARRHEEYKQKMGWA